MANEDYNSKLPLGDDYIVKEIENIKSVIGGIETTLEKEERAKKWHTIIQYHRN